MLINFYRLDTGEKLLIPEKLAAELATERHRRAKLARYREQFGDLTTA